MQIHVNSLNVTLHWNIHVWYLSEKRSYDVNQLDNCALSLLVLDRFWICSFWHANNQMWLRIYQWVWNSLFYSQSQFRHFMLTADYLCAVSAYKSLLVYCSAQSFLITTLCVKINESESQQNKLRYQR